MAYSKKTWTDRISAYPRRRLLTPVEGGDAVLYDITRQEGNITQEGDAFSAENLNDLETRIKTECDLLEQALANVQTGDTASGNISKGAYFVRNGIFYKAKTNIASGSGFNSNNCEATKVGDQLKSLADTFSNMDTWINNSLASLNSGMMATQQVVNTGFAQRPKGKYISFENFYVSGGTVTGLSFDCCDVLASRAWGLTVTAEGGNEIFGGILTNASNIANITFTIKCLTNSSYTGTVSRLDVIVWGY